MHRRRLRQIAHGDRDVAGERPAHADVDRLFDDDHVARARQRLAQGAGGEGPERHQRDEADADAVGAHLVDHVLDGAVERAHRDDDQFRVGGLVLAQQAAGGAPEPALEFGGELFDERQRRVLLVILEIAHFGERVGPDHRADRDRVLGVEDLHRLIGRQIGVDGGLVGNVDALDGVGQDEAVDADHRRHRKLLGEPERQDVQIGASWLDSANS